MHLSNLKLILNQLWFIYKGSIGRACAIVLYAKNMHYDEYLPMLFNDYSYVFPWDNFHYEEGIQKWPVGTIFFLTYR